MKTCKHCGSELSRSEKRICGTCNIWLHRHPETSDGNTELIVDLTVPLSNARNRTIPATYNGGMMAQSFTMDRRCSNVESHIPFHVHRNE